MRGFGGLSSLFTVDSLLDLMDTEDGGATVDAGLITPLFPAMGDGLGTDGRGAGTADTLLSLGCTNVDVQDKQSQNGFKTPDFHESPTGRAR